MTIADWEPDLPEPQSHEPERARYRASLGREVWTALSGTWLARIGVSIVGLALLLAVIGPYVTRYPPQEATIAVNRPPSFSHWFGTDPNGFDIFSRVIAAPRFDVAIALAATALSFAIGTSLGLLTSYFRGRVGAGVMRVADMIQAFPLFVFAIIIVVLTGRQLYNIIFVIALLNVPIYLRLVRGEVVSLRERPFVEAARAGGARELRIAVRHVLPNALSPALAHLPITIGFAILITAGLSFIGAGVRPPAAEWGSMIASGANGVVIGHWWTSMFPGAAIAITVFGFAVVGEQLRHVYLRQR